MSNGWEGRVAHNMVDMKNKRYGRLVGKKYLRQGVWLFKCDCGKLHEAKGRFVRSGNIRSCGCAALEAKSRNGKANVTHRLSKHPLYTVWLDMCRRCHDSRVRDFKNYGARGIEVCSEWRKNAYAFIKWALKKGWQPGLSIDRKDNEGNYTPKNCRFVTTEVQNNNTRANINITYQGETKSLALWSRDIRCKVGYRELWHRVQVLNWSPKAAITKGI